MVACVYCRKLWAATPSHARCPHCDGPLHTRKANAYNRCWAFLLSACIMYIPANLMPVMVTQTLFSEQQSTILGGVIFFWVSGEYGLAMIVFVASILVPLVKISALMFLLIASQKKSTWRLQQRTNLYRMLELIGRWSMLDVFVVAILVGLVRIPGYASITAGVGIVSFAAVVVFTMLASQSFDPRLAWDALDQHAIDTEFEDE